MCVCEREGGGGERGNDSERDSRESNVANLRCVVGSFCGARARRV